MSELSVGDRVRVARDEFPAYVGEYGRIVSIGERRLNKAGHVLGATSHNIEIRFEEPCNGFSGRWYRPEDVEAIV